MSDGGFHELAVAAAKEGLEKYHYEPRICDDKIRERLSHARRDHRLVLVLGAGISLSSGLDNWRSLVQKAASAMFSDTGLVDILPILNAGRRSSIIQIRFCESRAGLKTAFRVFSPGDAVSKL
jgi:hypothetical protein